MCAVHDRPPGMISSGGKSAGQSPHSDQENYERRGEGQNSAITSAFGADSFKLSPSGAVGPNLANGLIVR